MVAYTHMRAEEFLRKSGTHVEELISRYATATEGLTEDQINVRPKGAHWGVAEIAEHVRLANSFYLPAIESGLNSAVTGDEAEEVRHTWIGNLVAYGAGPRKASPAPRALHPAKRRYALPTLDSFATDHARLRDMIDASKDVSLVKTRVRNPFMPMFKMNLADCYLILTGHGDRHVSQIAEIAKALRLL